MHQPRQLRRQQRGPTCPQRLEMLQAPFVGTRFYLLHDGTSCFSSLLSRLLSLIPSKAAQFCPHQQNKRGTIPKRMRAAGWMSLPGVKTSPFLGLEGLPAPKPVLTLPAPPLLILKWSLPTVGSCSSLKMSQSFCVWKSRKTDIYMQQQRKPSSQPRNKSSHSHPYLWADKQSYPDLRIKWVARKADKTEWHAINWPRRKGGNERDTREKSIIKEMPDTNM